MQLSIWSNKFLGNGFAPTFFSNVHNSHTQHDFPCKRHAKNEFCGGSSNNSFDSNTEATSKVQKNNKGPIVKLGSFGHNLFKYWAYISSLCWWAIISIRITRNCPSLKMILLHNWGLGKVIFVWSILSWITHKNFSFDQIDYILHVWYKFLHDSWCKMCFLSFISYSIASLLCFPNLDIKSLRDSQIMHFAKTNLHFRTPTFRWCLFFNQLIANYKIPPILKSLHICNNTNKGLNQIRFQENGCLNNWTSPNM
jgi:hypothetical protein